MQSAFMLNWVTVRRYRYSYVYGVCRERRGELCVHLNIILGQRQSQHWAKPFSPARFLRRQHRRSPSVHISLSVNSHHCKKSLFGSKAVASSPSLWLPNEALYCLIPGGTWRISQKKVLAVVHQGWWPSVRAHMLETEGVPLRTSLGNHG